MSGVSIGSRYFVGVGVIVGPGRKIHDQGVGCAEVEVGMPYQARNIDDASIVFRQDNATDLPACPGIRPHVVEDQLHFALEQAVAILMLLVQPPAFDDPRPNRKAVGKNQRLGMPIPPRVVHFHDRAALIDMCRQFAKLHALDQSVGAASFSRDGLRILDRCGQRLFEQRRIGRRFACGEIVHLEGLPDTLLTLIVPEVRATGQLYAHACSGGTDGGISLADYFATTKYPGTAE
jgi:hypothetical protein